MAVIAAVFSFVFAGRLDGVFIQNSPQKGDCPPETVFPFVSVVATTLLQTSFIFNSLYNDKSPFFCIFLLHHTTLVCNILIFELLFQLYHNFSVKVFQSDLSRLKKDLDRLNLVLNYISENYKRPILWMRSQVLLISRLDISAVFSRKRWGLHFWNIRMNTDFLLSTKI